MIIFSRRNGGAFSSLRKKRENMEGYLQASRKLITVPISSGSWRVHRAIFEFARDVVGHT